MRFAVGVDYSSVAIDAALVPMDGAGRIVLARTPVVKVWSSAETAMRARQVGMAAAECMAHLQRSADAQGGQIALVVIEEPFAPQASAAVSMSSLYGAVSMAAGGGDRVLLNVRADEWRSALGLKQRAPSDVGRGLAKSAAAKARRGWMKGQSVDYARRVTAGSVALDDNAAEALLMALAGLAMSGASASARSAL